MSDPFEEKGRTTGKGRVERLGEIVRMDKGQQAIDELRDEFEQSSKQLQKKHAAEVERVSEESYLRGVEDTIGEAIKFQTGYAKMANDLIAQCYDENGEVDIDELNKRLGAIKDGRQSLEALIDRIIGKAKVRTEQSGSVNVIHTMEAIQQALSQPDDFDYDVE